MKRYHATTPDGELRFEATEDAVFLVEDGGLQIDVTWLLLAGTDFTDPSEALVDLYTDNGTGEAVSIEEVE